MVDLTYEDRMALFDVISTLKSGIMCNECQNIKYHDGIGLSWQIDQLQRLYDRVIAIQGTPTYNVSCMFDGSCFMESISVPAHIPVNSKIVFIEVESFCPDRDRLPTKRIGSSSTMHLYINDDLGKPFGAPCEVIRQRDEAAAVTKVVNIEVDKGSYIMFKMFDMEKHLYKVTLTLQPM